jgi:hypothetical protein
MTSKITTASGTINVGFPSPGVNNSSQGFRDNFTAINTAFTTASTELTDLQGKVLLKSALTGTTLDNDMNNGIIKNAQTLQFRNSTYSLGSNLSGTVEVDCSLGDVHIGVIDTTIGTLNLTLSHWAPAGTQGSVEVVLGVAAGQTITMPSAVVYGLETIEGCINNVVTVPSGVTRVHYKFNSLDCGTTVEIVPVDRPRMTVLTTYNNANVASYLDGTYSNANGNISDTRMAANINTTGNVTSNNATIGNTLRVGNITSGIITANSITLAGGAVNLSNSVSINLGNVSNITIEGSSGSAGKFLKSTSDGKLQWVEVASLESNAVIATGSNNLATIITSNGNHTLNELVGLSFQDSNLNITGNIFISSNIKANGTITGTLATPAQTNITSVGTLTSLGVSGIVTASTIVSNVATGTAPFIVTSATPVSNLAVDTASTVRASAQPNITSVGTLTMLSVTGNIGAGNIILSNGTLKVNGSVTAGTLVSNVAQGIAPLTVTSTTTVANLSAATAEFVSSSNQPNITSTGNLTSLVVSGVTTLGNISNVKITGGNASQILATDGSGNLSWINQSTLANALTSNVSGNFTFNDNATVHGNLTVDNDITSSLGNINLISGDMESNTITVHNGGQVHGNLTIDTANITTLTVTGAFTANGNVTMNGNINIAAPNATTTLKTLVLTGGNTTSNTGNLSAGNIQLTGSITAQSITANAIVTPTGVVNGTTVGTAGQIIIDTGANKIWVCYGGTVWKSATLS